MRRPSRSARLVSVCLAGTTAEHVSENKRRISLLKEVVELICDQEEWHPIDAIVLPGGLFRLDAPLARKPHAERVKCIESSTFGREAMDICLELADKSPGIPLVFGVIADGRAAQERPDQVCVAINSRGVQGMARKIFPTDIETDGRRILLQSTADFASSDRFLELGNGSVAVLSACYDLFGLAEDPNSPSIRTRAIRYLWDGRRVIQHGEDGFRRLRDECLAAWRSQLQDKTPDVAIATIHGFELPGRDGYWQRHGIATASAAIKGGLVVGAANFTKRLPEGETSALAAKRVPKIHLADPLHRTARALKPAAVAELLGSKPRALVRLFTA